MGEPSLTWLAIRFVYTQLYVNSFLAMYVLSSLGQSCWFTPANLRINSKVYFEGVTRRPIPVVELPMRGEYVEHTPERPTINDIGMAGFHNVDNDGDLQVTFSFLMVFIVLILRISCSGNFTLRIYRWGRKFTRRLRRPS
jgi:hypothetical protein